MENKNNNHVYIGMEFLFLFIVMLFLSETILWMFGTDVNSFNIRALTGFGSLIITWCLFSFVLKIK